MVHTALIMAGSSQKEGNPLLMKAQVDNKALIRLQDKYLIEYVLDAIDEAPSIDNIVIVGLKKEQLPERLNKKTVFIEFNGSRINNILTGLRYHKENLDGSHVVIFPSDIPFMNGAIIEKTIEQMNIEETDMDIYYPLVSKSAFDRTYPNAKRSFRKFREGTYAGGDIITLKVQTGLDNADIINTLVTNRKSMIKYILSFSPLFLVRYLLGILSVNSISMFFEKKFNIFATIFFSEFPEIAMDLDYPDQIEKFDNLLGTK
jgi:GTP:adenosylcobinamide-phosphate guanylyltransferase